MNKYLKTIFLILLMLFLSIYFSKYTTNYYENQKVLTEEALIRYEEDLKNGKEINPEDYVEQEKNYNNKVSELGIKSSKFIEKLFNKSIRKILKYLEGLDNYE